MSTPPFINPDGPLEMDTLLAAVPVRNRSVRFEQRGDAELVAWVPIRKKWYLGPPFSWLMPVSSHRIVALDSLGREVLDACDGTSTVEQIIERFAAAHHLRFHQARLSVMEFLRQLMRRGLIAVVCQGGEETDK